MPPGSPVASGGRSQAGAAAPAGVPVTALTPVKSGHLTPLNQVSKPYRATQTRWRDLDAQQGVHGAGPIGMLALQASCGGTGGPSGTGCSRASRSGMHVPELTSDVGWIVSLELTFAPQRRARGTPASSSRIISNRNSCSHVVLVAGIAWRRTG